MDNVYNSIVKDGMCSIFNRTPIDFQLGVTTHLLKMMSGNITAEPVLMVQPTGSGNGAFPNSDHLNKLALFFCPNCLIKPNDIYFH